MTGKKKHRGAVLLILVLILAVCVVGYVVLLRSNEAAEEEEDGGEETESLYELPEDANVVTLSYEREGENISLVWSDGEGAWQRADDEDFPVDSSAVNTMVTDLTGAQIARVINEDGSDLAEYGLEEPAFTVTVTDSTGTSSTFLIGDENSIDGGCYIMAEGDSRVLMADAVLATAFNCGWYDLAAVDDGPDIDRDDLEDITVTEGERVTELVYDGDGKPALDATGDAVLFFRTETGYAAMDSSYQKKILNGVEDFEYESLAVYDPSEEDLTACGLDAPALTVTVNYTTEEEIEAESGETDTGDDEDAEPETETVIEEHTYTLTVGACDAESEVYYVRHDGSSSIFTMDADTVERLMNLDAEQMRPLDPANVAEGTIDSFDVTREGTTVTYSIERDVPVTAEDDAEETGEDDSTEDDAVSYVDLYYRDGEAIEAEEYTEALEAVTGLEGVRLLAEGEAVEDAAAVTVVFHRNVAAYATVTVELIPWNENYYQMAADGGEPFAAVDIVDVNNLLYTVFSE